MSETFQLFDYASAFLAEDVYGGDAVQVPLRRPRRIQLHAERGWRLPPQARSVACPSPWANPFRIGAPCGFRKDGAPQIPALSREQALAMFERLCRGELADDMHPHGYKWLKRLRRRYPGRTVAQVIRAELGGRDLACFCAPGSACHAEVLLRLANPPER